MACRLSSHVVGGLAMPHEVQHFGQASASRERTHAAHVRTSLILAVGCTQGKACSRPGGGDGGDRSQIHSQHEEGTRSGEGEVFFCALHAHGTGGNELQSGSSCLWVGTQIAAVLRRCVGAQSNFALGGFTFIIIEFVEERIGQDDQICFRRR